MDDNKDPALDPLYTVKTHGIPFEPMDFETFRGLYCEERDMKEYGEINMPGNSFGEEGNEANDSSVDSKELDFVMLIGRITDLKNVTTMKGDRMAIFTLEDRVGKVRVVVFPEVFAACEESILEGAKVIVFGKEQRDEIGKVTIIASTVGSTGLLEKLLACKK